MSQLDAKCAALNQSILAKAFRGELVPTEAELARREGREYEAAATGRVCVPTNGQQQSPKK